MVVRPCPAGINQVRNAEERGPRRGAVVHMSAKGAGGVKRSPVLAGIDKVSERIRTGRLKKILSPRVDACP